MFYLFTSLTLLPYYLSYLFTFLTFYISYPITFLTLLPLLPYYLFIPCCVVYFVGQIIATML